MASFFDGWRRGCPTEAHERSTSATGRMSIVGPHGTVAWVLYRVFRPVSAGTAKAAAALRVAYAGVFAVAVAQSVCVCARSATAAASRRIRPPCWRDRATRRLLGRSLILGLHLLGLAWLAYRSGYAPKLLGVLLGVAGVGYLLDSPGACCSSQAAGSRSPR